MPRSFRILAAIILLPLLAAPALAQTSDTGSSHYYSEDTINAGLGPVPDTVNRETPQAMMESFLFAAKADAWKTAAHMLDLSNMDPQKQAALGPVLARRLNQIVRHAMWLDWGDLPDRPDALEANASSKNPLAGEPRRNIRLAIIDLPGRPVSIRIARVKPKDGDPVWLFSRQTVGNINEMYAYYGPTAFERSLPAWMRKTAFWTLAWWEVIALPLVFLIGLGAAALVYVWLGRLKQHRRYRLAAGILDAVQLPVALFVCVGTFSLVRSWLFTFSGAVNAFLGPLQTVLIVIALALIAVRIVDAVLERVVQHNIRELGDAEAAEQRDLYTNISAARRAAIVVAFLVGAALVLIQVNAFQTLGFSLLASAGVLGLIFAFAARSVLANIMSSLQIALAKTARIGDAVLYAGDWCYVEKINFTYVQLKSWDNRRLMVPVSQLVSNTLENWTKQDASLIKPVVLRLDHRADVDKLREAFGKFVEESDDVIQKDQAKAQVIDHDWNGMVLRFTVTGEDPVSAWGMHCRLREEMLKVAARLESEGADVPDRAVYLPREREVKVEAFAGD
ncbi:mechanosensitive ion channel family protein [Jiella sp. M17.18]|uniref:mechanosensitive ion channel family protein n=1 Tax=Jiella sp. M17.18 TaxID=3234247 RepID=UPI0034DF9DD1